MLAREAHRPTVTFGPFEGAIRRRLTASLRPMADRGSALLPVHEMLEALEAWRVEQSDAGIDVLRGALAHLLVAYDVLGVHISLDAPPLPALRVGAGTLAGRRPTGAKPIARTLVLGDQPDRTATLEIDAAS